MLENIIRTNDYRGILAQDGWETAELTVMTNHPPAVAIGILSQLKKIEHQCRICGRIRYLSPEVYRRAYEGEGECLDCRRKAGN